MSYRRTDESNEHRDDPARGPQASAASVTLPFMKTMTKGPWVITGAASGFGREFAQRLAARGETLALWDRDKEGLAETSRLVGSARHQTFVVDVTDEEGVLATARATQATLGSVAHVINSAGILRVGDASNVTPADRRAMMDINYHGSVSVTHALLPQLQSSSGRSVALFIASVAGLRGFPGLAGYCASKFAVVGYGQALREELHGSNVDVRVLCPPAGDTPMLRNVEHKPGVFKLSPPVSAAQVVDATLRGIEREPWIILVDASSKVVRRVDRLAPKLVDQLVRFAKS